MGKRYWADFVSDARIKEKECAGPRQSPPQATNSEKEMAESHGNIGHCSFNKTEKALFFCLLSYLTVKMVGYALFIHPLVPPDEVDLFGRCVAFSKVAGIPLDSPDTAEYGLIARRPFLYFWVMGKLLFLNIFPLDDLMFLRLLNIPLALITVWIAYRIGCMFSLSKPARLLNVVLLSSTLQYWTLSSTVTYDNFVNLASILSFFFFFMVLQKFEANRFLAFVLVLSLGCLIKVSFMPLALMFAAAYIVRRGGSIRIDADLFMEKLRKRQALTASLLLGSVIAASFVLKLYIGNVIHYGVVSPRPVDVLPEELALKNRIVRRNWIVREFKEGNLSYDRAMEEISFINNAGNRRRAVQLVNASRTMALTIEDRPAKMKPLLYSIIWTKVMLYRTFGFQGNGNRVIPPAPFVLPVVGAMFLLCILMTIMNLEEFTKSGQAIYSFGISFSYIMVLLWLVGYRIYYKFGVYDFTLNGRLLFPVLPILTILTIRYGVSRLPLKFQTGLCILLAAFFMYSDLPYFLSQLDRCWFWGAESLPGCIF